MTHASLKTAAEDNTFAAVKKSLPTFMVDPRIIQIIPGAYGRPVDHEHVQTMKRAWRASKGNNPLPPISLRMINGKPALNAGQHRLTAYLELIAEGEPIERVPCTEFKGTDKEAIIFMLGENSGKPWQMLELGERYAELVNKFGMSYDEVAQVRGMSVQHVKDCIGLTDAPADIKQAINTGQVAAATAMKLVKSVGAAEASKTIKQAQGAIAAGVKAPKGGKITQKVIDNLGKSKVDELAARGKFCKEHLQSMLESPSFTREQKDAIRITLRAIGGRLPDGVAEAPKLDHVGEYLTEMRANSNDLVSGAARTLADYRAGKFIAPNLSPEAKSYGHMCWLQDLSSNSKNPAVRAGSHWFLAVLDANRSGGEIAPPPSVLPLDKAIQMEIDGEGAVNAESMCPEHAGLISYLRGK